MVPQPDRGVSKPGDGTISIDVMDTEAAMVVLANLRGDVIYRQSLVGTDVPITVDKPAKSGLYLVKVKDAQGKWDMTKVVVSPRQMVGRMQNNDR